MNREQRNDRVTELRKQGWEGGDIATEIGCSLATVWRILKAAGLSPRVKRPVAERLQEKLIATPSGCLEFQGFCNSGGYGQIYVGGKNLLAHRVAFELAHGPIPSGLHVCHHCDNPSCCNPDHLFLGTQAENLADMVSKGRQPTKQTPEKLEQLRELRSQGLTLKEIGAALGIGYVTAWNWLRELEAN